MTYDCTFYVMVQEQWTIFDKFHSQIDNTWFSEQSPKLSITSSEQIIMDWLRVRLNLILFAYLVADLGMYTNQEMNTTLILFTLLHGE